MAINSKINLKKLMCEILHVPINDVMFNINTENCSQWDSIAHIEIITMLEKITGDTIGPEKVSELISFEAIFEYLKESGFEVE